MAEPPLFKVNSYHLDSYYQEGISCKMFKDENEAIEYAKEKSKNHGEFSVVTENGTFWSRPTTKTILLLKVDNNVFGAFTDFETIVKSCVFSKLCKNKFDLITRLMKKNPTISIHSIPINLVTTGSILY